MNCEVCFVEGNEVKLYDAILNGKITTICQRCSIVENVPLIKKPNSEQLKESESIKVAQTMRNLSGIKIEKKQETFFQEDKLKELDNNPELELPEKDSLNLIDNFHWEIMKQRRRKGLTQEKLAEALGESEIAIKLLEGSKLPENAEILIKKLEQLFQIELKNLPKKEEIEEPVLLDEVGKEIEILPEEEMVFIEDDLDEDQEDQEPKENYVPVQPSGDVDLKKVDKENVTIGDLQRIHQKKSELIKEEQMQEQMKLEERKKLLLASREKDRLKMEEQKRQELLKKEREEQERKRIIEEKKQELLKLKEKEFEKINSSLGGLELMEDKVEKENVEEFDQELS